ncbi:MAG: hypothetical protein KKA19_01785 [Candidatus Margulisbacteria bacterium]|nr:hypothetical protein [Candidatus Margulisiibacteriota bacterium]
MKKIKATSIESINNKQPKEIEVKFLLKKLPGNFKYYKDIRQGFLNKNDKVVQKVIQENFSTNYPELELKNIDVVRIRETKGPANNQVEYTMTLKGPGHLERSEYEVDINQDLFEKLWHKTTLGHITKRRYKEKITTKLIIEIDEYFDNLKGLYTAEVELTNPELEKYIMKMIKGLYRLNDDEIKDVTYDKRYKNNNLAQINSAQSLLF